MKTEDTRTLIERYYEALTSADVSTIKQCLADDIVWQLPRSVANAEGFAVQTDSEGRVSGEQVLLELGGDTVKKSFDISKPFALDVRHMIVEGNKAVVQQRITATARATGRPYDNQYCWIYTCDDGVIVHMEEYTDSLGADLSMNPNR